MKEHYMTCNRPRKPSSLLVFVDRFLPDEFMYPKILAQRNAMLNSFDHAMEAFLDCVNQLANHIRLSYPQFRLPYR